ncbi:MAG: hypothetical protein KAT32_00175 [Candidatus Moranbacteria bacterium]|nr:hypothetical protein [Candidatus Moranbacteria bacterium]
MEQDSQNKQEEVQLQTTKKIDTHSYKGWLNSDNFLKRAFAVYGYAMVASLIVSIPFFILYFFMIIMFIMISVGSSA